MSLRVDIHASAGSFDLNVAFQIDSHTAALLGPSGSGKTLTLRAIAGLLSPDYGRISLDGEFLYDSRHSIDVPIRKRHVGYMFQDYALFPHLTVAENIAFGLRGVPKDEAKDLVSWTIAQLRLDGLDGRYPSRLSGGERQRVALGRALAPQPRLLLLDEPFSALDVPTRSALTEEFLEMRATIDVPMLLVTHDIGEAYALCDELIVLDAGHVLQGGAKDAVFNHPASPQAAHLVGMQNLLRGSVVETSAIGAVVEAAGIRIRLDAQIKTGSAVRVAFRAGAVEATRSSRRNATLERLINRGTHVTGVFSTLDGASVIATLGQSVDDSLLGTGWQLTVRNGAAIGWPV